MGIYAAPACPHHQMLKQNSGNSCTAYQRNATFGRTPVLSFSGRTFRHRR